MIKKSLISVFLLGSSMKMVLFLLLMVVLIPGEYTEINSSRSL